MQILEQTGPDAADFLHRITTANIKALILGTWTPACILNPQGKVRSAFWILRESEQTFFLLVDSEQDQNDTHVLLSVLDEFKFGEKFEIAGVERESEKALLEKYPLNLPTEAERILALQPKLGHELTTETNPLDAGAFDWIASNKGCYPGQEVIEKIIAIGSPSRNLCLLALQSGKPKPGDALLIEGKEAGKITSVAGSVALGIVRKTNAEKGTRFSTASGAELEIQKKKVATT